jgi:hypothetical protein
MFNYTDSHIIKLNSDTPIHTKSDSAYTGYVINNNLDPVLDAKRYVTYADTKLFEPIGKPLIAESTVLLNSQARMSRRVSKYYAALQPFQNCQNTLPRGANMYSFALNPFDISPSGTTNMSQIEDTDIGLRMNPIININHKAKFRAYALCYNVWRVNNGLSASVFIR